MHTLKHFYYIHGKQIVCFNDLQKKIINIIPCDVLAFFVIQGCRPAFTLSFKNL